MQAQIILRLLPDFQLQEQPLQILNCLQKHIGPDVKMKAAGGISSLDDAEKFLALGADRLGTSRMIKLVKNEEASGY